MKVNTVTESLWGNVIPYWNDSYIEDGETSPRKPTITVYKGTSDCAVVIFPGGGYAMRAEHGDTGERDDLPEGDVRALRRRDEDGRKRTPLLFPRHRFEGDGHTRREDKADDEHGKETREDQRRRRSRSSSYYG